MGQVTKGERMADVESEEIVEETTPITPWGVVTGYLGGLGGIQKKAADLGAFKESVKNLDVGQRAEALVRFSVAVTELGTLTVLLREALGELKAKNE